MPSRVVAAPVAVTGFAAVGEEYNENIFFRADKVEDYVTAVTAGIGVDYRRPRTEITFAGRNTAEFFARNTREGDPIRFQSGLLDVRHEISSKLSAGFSEAVRHLSETRTGESFAGVEAPPAEQASTLLQRGEVLSNSGKLDLEYRPAPRWTGTLGGRADVTEFRRPRARDVQGGARMGIEYALRRNASLLVEHEYRRFAFDATGGDSETYGPRAGVRYDIGPSWQFEAFAGLSVARVIRSEKDRKSGQVEPTFAVGVRKRFARWSMNVRGSRDFTSSAGVAGLSVTDSWSVNSRFRLSGHLSAFLSAGWVRFDTEATDFWALTTGAAVEWLFRRGMTGRAAYQYRRREATNTARAGVLEAGVAEGSIVSLRIEISRDIWRGST